MVKVYKSQVRTGNIGVNVSSANSVANSLERQAQALNNFSNELTARATSIAKEKGILAAQEATLSDIITIDTKTGNPIAYANEDMFTGRSYRLAKNQIIDQRYELAITDDLKRKQIELVKKYSFNPKAFTESFASYYTGKVNGANPKFTNIANQLGETLSIKGNATIQANIVAEENKQNRITLGIVNEDYLRNASIAGVNGVSKEKINQMANSFSESHKPHIETGLITSGTSQELKNKGLIQWAGSSLTHYITKILPQADIIKQLEGKLFIQRAITEGLIKTPEGLPNENYLKDILETYYGSRPDRDDQQNVINKIKNAELIVGKQNDLELAKQTLSANVLLEDIQKDFTNIENIEIELEERKITDDKLVKEIIKNYQTEKRTRISNQYNDINPADGLFQIEKFNFESSPDDYSDTIIPITTQLIQKGLLLSQSNIKDKSKEYTKLQNQKEVIIRTLNTELTDLLLDGIKQDPSKAQEKINTYNLFVSQGFKISTKATEQEKALMINIAQFTKDKDLIKAIKGDYYANISEVTKFSKEYFAELTTNIIKQQEDIDKKFESELKNKKINLIDKLIRDQPAFYESKQMMAANNAHNYLLEQIKMMQISGQLSPNEANSRTNKLLDYRHAYLASATISAVLQRNHTEQELNSLKNFFNGDLNAIDNVAPDLKDWYLALNKQTQNSIFDNNQRFQNMIEIARKNNNITNTQNKDILKSLSLRNGDITGETSNIYKYLVPDSNGDGIPDVLPRDYFSSPDLLKSPIFLDFISNGNIPNEMYNLLSALENGNWYEFGDADPRQFLKNIEFILNYRDPDRESDSHNIVPIDFIKQNSKNKWIALLDMFAGDSIMGLTEDSFKQAIESRKQRLENHQERKAQIVEGKGNKGKNLDQKFRNFIIDTLKLNSTDFETINMYEGILNSGIEFFINDKDEAETYLKNMHNKIFVETKTVYDNPNSVDKINVNAYALKKYVPEKRVLTNTMTDIMISDIYPALLDYASSQSTEEEQQRNFVNQVLNRPVVMDGYKAFMPTGVDKTGQINTMISTTDTNNAIRFRLVPLKNYNRQSVEQFTDEDFPRGMDYYALKPKENEYAVFVDIDGSKENPMFVPLISGQRQTDLDSLSLHHYKNIEKGQAIRNKDGSLSTVMSATFSMSIGENMPEYHFIVPTVFDGQIYPIETDEQINTLFKRITQDYNLLDFPHFLDAKEANAFYENLKQTWLDIGDNPNLAKTILESYNTEVRDIKVIDIAGRANKYFREDALKILGEVDLGSNSASQMLQRGIANLNFKKDLSRENILLEEIIIDGGDYSDKLINIPPKSKGTLDLQSGSQWWQNWFKNNFGNSVDTFYKNVGEALEASPEFKNRIHNFFYREQ
tara:strand:+ start:558 stop:4661 length:4104 start_codon:yes stop_codon:yes gene_type:complete